MATVALVPPIDEPERILLYGGASVGKTRAILQTARRCPNRTFFIIDNDRSYRRMVALGYQDLENLQITVVDHEDWEEQRDAAIELCKQCGPDDFFVYDMLTETWAAVQEWFTKKVYGEDSADFFLRLRIEKEAKSTKGPVNLMNDDRWTVINAQYHKLQSAILKCEGHVICTSEQTRVDPERTDRELRREFSGFGYIPKGNKRWPHIFSTVLLLDHPRTGEWRISTIKDREREELDDAELEDFSRDYLQKVAGWKMKPLSSS